VGCGRVLVDCERKFGVPGRLERAGEEERGAEGAGEKEERGGGGAIDMIELSWR